VEGAGFRGPCLVVFTCDASDADRFWLNRDHLPEHADLWAVRPSLTELAGAIGARTEPVPDSVGLR